MTREQEKKGLVKSIESQLQDFCKKFDVKLRSIKPERQPNNCTICTGKIILEFVV